MQEHKMRNYFEVYFVMETLQSMLKTVCQLILWRLVSLAVGLGDKTNYAHYSCPLLSATLMSAIPR